MSAADRQKLDKLWTRPGHSYAAFAGRHLLRKRAAHEKSLSSEVVDEYLTEEPAYTRFRPRKEQFPKPFYNLVKLWHLVEADLLETGRVANFNSGTRYLLLVIECTSRKIFVRPLPNKEGGTVAKAFKTILKQFDQIPDLCRTDRGSEFRDKNNFQKVLSDNNIRHVYANNTEKCAMCERAGQTLQRRLHRYMTYKNTYRFLNVLQDIVKSINDTPHASTGIAPNRFTQKDVYPSWEKYYLKHLPLPSRRPFRFKPGDKVRASFLRRGMDKSYRGTYTGEIFTVKARRLTNPHSYELLNYDGGPVAGVFFEEELVPARDRPDQAYMIQDTFKTRVDPVTKRKQSLVNFEGWSKTHRRWVDQSSVKTTGRSSSK